VLALFAIAGGATIGWGILWFPLAVLIQTMLLVGLGLLVSPLCVLYSDLERTTKLILRALFYASPIIYGVADLPGIFRELAAFNPLSGIFTLYRAGFFPDQWDTLSVVMSVIISAALLGLGTWVFRRLERPVLKEL
jgi:ABC-2 type transport system permease protein